VCKSKGHAKACAKKGHIRELAKWADFLGFCCAFLLALFMLSARQIGICQAIKLLSLLLLEDF
jgi:hypothetical protein